MKVEITKEEQVFKPVVLAVTFESQEELAAYAQYLGGTTGALERAALANGTSRVVATDEAKELHVSLINYAMFHELDEICPVPR